MHLNSASALFNGFWKMAEKWYQADPVFAVEVSDCAL